MSATDAIQQLNRDLGDKVIEDAKRDPRAYPGKFVGIGNGSSVVVTKDLSELVLQFKNAEPDPAKTYGVEIGR